MSLKLFKKTNKLFVDTRVVQFQFLFALFAISGYVYIIGDSDINFFDGYVLRIISECWPGETSEFCETVRKDFGCPASDQLCVGNNYWMQVNKQAIFLAVLLGVLRLIPSLVGVVTHRRKFRFATAFEVIWYPIMALSVFLGGAIDVFYFWLRNRPIPDELPWLNGVGMFIYTKTFTGSPVIVESADLLYTFGISVIFLIILFFVAMFVYRASGLKKDMA